MLRGKVFHRKAPEKAILGLNVSKDAQRERERERVGVGRRQLISIMSPSVLFQLASLKWLSREDVN